MSENVMETMIKETAKIQQKLLKGFENLMNIKDVEAGVTPKELVYKEDKVQLFYYKPRAKSVCPVPLLVVYALVNRQYMMDIQDDLSLDTTAQCSAFWDKIGYVVGSALTGSPSCPVY